MTLELGQVADWIHAEGDFDSSKKAVGYSIDSRTIGAGELFFAVKGERVDGHDFIEAAIENGAVAAVVSMRWLAPAGFDECRLLRVPDACDDCVLDAMQTLAHAVRMQWGKRVIGVTGSAGKTTTKECIAEVLATQCNVLKTQGNFNNHFGLPLTLLRLEPVHDVAVIEMGMNHAGEIAALAKIASPDWGVVSNVGWAHTEFFADGIEGVARAKRELIESLPAEGLAILNADDNRVAAFASGREDFTVFYGTSAIATVRAEDLHDLGLGGTRFHVLVGQQRHAMQMHLIGRHNVLNALAAIGVGTRSGIPLAACCAALETLRPSPKRGNILEFHGGRLINDTYNANPSAFAAMLTALKNTPATRRIVIAGEMLELGPDSAQLHANVAAVALASNVDILIGVRGDAQKFVDTFNLNNKHGEFYETPEAAGEWMRDNLREGDVVLLKGSRGVQLERALLALEGVGT